MILLMGPSGAGKSSQAVALAAQHPQLVKIELGELLRAHQDEDVKSTLQQGDLVADELVNQLMTKAITAVEDPQEPLLDGYPRRLSQIKTLSQIKGANLQVRLVILLEVSLDTITKRLNQRGRHDDVKDTIERKWRIYQTQTLPVIEYYRQNELVRTVNGGQDPAAVTAAIERLLI